MTGPGDFNDLYSQVQQIFLVVLAVAGAIVAAFKTLRKRKNQQPDEPVVRVPSDALSREHPDPVVRSLQAQLRQMDERFKTMAAIQAESDAHEEDNRRTINKMLKESREQDDTIYWLRRIIRRVLDSWPADHSGPPPLTPHEWEVVGVDEDTRPRPGMLNRGFGSESSI